MRRRQMHAYRTREKQKTLATTLAFFVLVGVIVIISCVPTWHTPRLQPTFEPTTAYVCIDLPESQQKDAFEAVNAWDASLKRWRRFKPVEGKHSYCTINVAETMIPYALDAHALAWVSEIGSITSGHGYVYMLKGSYERDTKGILMHEIGHILGAQHMQGSLMNAKHYPHLYKCPDNITVAQVAAWNKISIDLLSWCLP